MKSTVGYIAMAFLPRNLPHAIANTEDQIYPPELKHLFLLYQRGKNKRFPGHVRHDMPFEITQVDVEGVWPQLWMLKLEAYLELTKTDFSVIWDEDDRFPPFYTLRMIQALEANPSKHVAWTYKMRKARKGLYKYYKHDCPVGCAVFRTEFLRRMAKRIVNEYPKKWSDGRRHNKRQQPRPTPNNPTRMNYGALDNQMCIRIINEHSGKILVVDPATVELEVIIKGFDARYFEMPTGLKTYIQHSEQYSVKKDPAEDIDR